MSSTANLILMAMPAPRTQDMMLQSIREHGVDKLLGSTMFAPGNWHQSLTIPYDDGPETQDALRRVGARVLSASVELILNRIAGSNGPNGKHHVAFRAYGRPRGFTALVSDIRAALRSEGLVDGGKTPHVTISYWSPIVLATIPISPIVWKIEDILLVRGGGAPFHYQELARWRLAPPPSEQLSLFPFP